MYINAENVTYFDSFGVEHIPKEIKQFIRNKNIATNIYRTQAYDSITYGQFCTVFNNFMLNGKGFLEYRNLFSPNGYKKNGKIILTYFQWQKSILMFAIQNLKTLKYHIFLKNISSLYCLQQASSWIQKKI